MRPTVAASHHADRARVACVRARRPRQTARLASTSRNAAASSSRSPITSMRASDAGPRLQQSRCPGVGVDRMPIGRPARFTMTAPSATTAAPRCRRSHWPPARHSRRGVPGQPGPCGASPGVVRAGRRRCASHAPAPRLRPGRRDVAETVAIHTALGTRRTGTNATAHSAVAPAAVTVEPGPITKPPTNEAAAKRPNRRAVTAPYVAVDASALSTS